LSISTKKYARRWLGISFWLSHLKTLLFISPWRSPIEVLSWQWRHTSANVIETATEVESIVWIELNWILTYYYAIAFSWIKTLKNIHLTNLISVHLLCPYNFFVHQYFFTKFCVLTISCISTLFPCSNLSNLIVRRVQPWTYKIHIMHKNIVWMRERKLHMIFSNTTEIHISEKHNIWVHYLFNSVT
jgi:hypothetical protein